MSIASSSVSIDEVCGRSVGLAASRCSFGSCFKGVRRLEAAVASPKPATEVSNRHDIEGILIKRG